MTQITAPYNFVPLSGWIFFPDWADKVSHDVPFREGVSGQLELEITAHSPILVGGKQEKATKQKPGEVHFCQINNRYTIPGTTLKGMIRNVLEIASFGKMGYVDDRRLGIRDISGARVKAAYMEKVKEQRAGFLRLRPDGVTQDKGDVRAAEIVPCEFVHISHRDMEKYLKKPDLSLFIRGMTVEKKYRKWGDISTQPQQAKLPEIQFNDIQINRNGTKMAVGLGYGQYQGKLVFTGQISDKRPGRDGRPNKSGKYRDFVFYNHKANSDALPVPQSVLADFRFIHGEEDKPQEGEQKRLEADKPWSGYWKEKFFNNEEIPVFYHIDERTNEIRSIGLAYMYRLAYKHSIAETIGHTNPYHHPRLIATHQFEKKLDLTEVLFGLVDENEQLPALKSRISFGHALVQGNPQEKALEPTILNGPKPTFFPNYLQQPKARHNQLPRDVAYTTYMDDKAELRGWKRYPVRQGFQIQKPSEQQAENKAVQVQLFPLPEKTVFNSTVRFHNLKPEELGALLWALTWGENEQLRHALGMGKPFGLGQISISIKSGQICSNQQPQEKPQSLNTADYLHKFTALMEEKFTDAQKSHNPVAWHDSEQLVHLRTMANPKNADSNKLRHMRLNVPRPNDFQEAKKAGLVLPEYVADFPAIRRDEQLFRRYSIFDWQRLAETEKEQRIEKERLEKEQAKQEARRAKMSPLELSMEKVITDAPAGQKMFVSLLNALEKGEWSDAGEKKQVASEIKSSMMKEKQWKEVSQKKNPAKDKDYQITLRVLKFFNN